MIPVLRLLFIGDLVGDFGVDSVSAALPTIKQKFKIDFCIANAENSHEGKGVNEVIVKRLYKAGVDVITGGDHSFDKHLIFPYMNKDPRLLRPMNYPKGVPGLGYGIYPTVFPDVKIGVLNIRGNTFFQNPIRCPFSTADYCIGEMAKETNLIFVDFHAEASAEKMAMGWHLDGRVSVMAGTHTHVQTADERIFPQGTGYITDVGFTGAHDSVIGMDKQTAIYRFIHQIPQKYKLGEGNPRIQGAIFTIDVKSGKTHHIERLNWQVYLKPKTEESAAKQPEQENAPTPPENPNGE